MEEKNKDKKKSGRIKLIIFLIIIIVLLANITPLLQLFFKGSIETTIINIGTLSKDENVEGYIIRKEHIVEEESKRSIEKIVEEGEKVAKGENIFKYYSDENIEETLEQITSIDKQINDALTIEENHLVSSTTKSIEKNIEKELKDLSNMKSLKDIQKKQNALNSLSYEKAIEIANLSPKGSTLKELINQKNNLEKELTAKSTFIKSDRSGIVSYRIDGKETDFSTDDLGKFTKEYLNSFDIETDSIIATSNKVAKIIDNFVCYIAIVSNSDEAQNAKIGTKVSIAIPSGDIINAKLEKINDGSGKEKILIFSINNKVEELNPYRKANFNLIWWNKTGFKVPTSAIIEENSLSYVMKKSSYIQSFSKTLVKIIKTADNYSIISNYSQSEIKELGIGDDVSTSISLYDEIKIDASVENTG